MGTVQVGGGVVYKGESINDEWNDALQLLLSEIVRRKLTDDCEDAPFAKAYGTNYVNDTFMLHRYCWCEDDDCPWCGGCQCDEGAFWYKVEGRECTWQEWHDYFEERTPDLFTTPIDEWEESARLANANRESGRYEDQTCDYCRGTKFASYGQIKGWEVPLFWHKPSGVRISWYKRLMRDLELFVPDGCTITATDVLNDCIKSLG